MQQIFLCFAVALSIQSCQANGELAPVDNGKDVAFALAADLLRSATLTASSLSPMSLVVRLTSFLPIGQPDARRIFD